MKFTELNLDSSLLEAISHMGFVEATPIQALAIPLILENKDLIACAQTGTGKTGAFVLPILNKLIGKEDTSVDTLIIVPTRELALQIEQEIQGLSYFVSVGSKAVYGGGDGKDFNQQKLALTEGTDIIVATPGKLLSHLRLGYVKFDKIKHLVLDEADRMLDMGFHEDIQNIISFIPKKHQTLMFSATMPPEIRKLAKKILFQPEEIALEMSKPAEGVAQSAYLVFDNQKIGIIKHILGERKNYDSIIIFTATKSKVTDIVRDLKRNGFAATGISSNLDQSEREEVLLGFRSKRIKVLVATDVMSRGIDIKDINLVVNFDVPGDAEDYVHRIGRTARANTKGEAITLVNNKDMGRLKRIEHLIEYKVPQLKLPDNLGDGPKMRDKAAHHGKKNFYKNKKKFYKKGKSNRYKK